MGTDTTVTQATLLTTKEFAQATGVSVRTLKYWRKSSKLTTFAKKLQSWNQEKIGITNF